MNSINAALIFECLSYSIRLDIYRLLVKKGTEGMVAGEIGVSRRISLTIALSARRNAARRRLTANGQHPEHVASCQSPPANRSRSLTPHAIAHLS